MLLRFLSDRRGRRMPVSTRRLAAAATFLIASARLTGSAVSAWPDRRALRATSLHSAAGVDRWPAGGELVEALREVGASARRKSHGAQQPEF